MMRGIKGRSRRSRRRERGSEGPFWPILEHRDPLIRGKYELRDIDRIGKRVSLNGWKALP
jgi:hypothetical protein